jgi:3-deoxy-D-manno-octulosonic acid (KDO) 8-phosphate synthase
VGGFIFEACFDKANGASVAACRGLGLREGLRILAGVKAEASPSSPASTRPGRPDRSRKWPMCCKFRRSCAGKRTSSWPPGGLGDASGGQPQFIEPLARAAVAAGVNGVFVEVLDAPEKALSDGSNALRLSLLRGFWEKLKAIHAVVA